MPAARDSDWAHVHVAGGDRAAAAPYLPYARKLLGFVKQDAAVNRLTTHQAVRRLPDGAVVLAELRGGIPRMTITPPERRPSGLEGTFLPTGFVVTARSTAQPTGIDADFPEQILRLEDDGWHTYFKSKAVAGYEAFAGEKGTYGLRFHDGLGAAGNLDWLGARPEGGTDAERVRLNYYGPMRRYWYDGWRKPDAQYGRWVFLNGQVLLDLEEANAQRTAVGLPAFAETLVLGAAYREGWLYVMQARINAFGPEATTIPDQDGFPEGSAGWISPPYPDGDTDLRLVRYRVTARPEQAPQPAVYGVNAKTAETLWTRTGRGLVNPWVFAPDVSVCETFAMPDELRAMKWGASTTSSPGDEFTAQLSPSESSEHLTIALTHTGGAVIADAAIEAVSIEFTIRAGFDSEVPLGLYSEVAAAIAADYTADGARVELIYTDRIYHSPTSGPEDHTLDYATLRIGAGAEFTVADRSFNGSQFSAELSSLALCDLRHGLAVLEVARGTAGEDTVSSMELLQEGLPVGAAASSVAMFPNFAYDMANWWATVAERTFNATEVVEVSPLFLLLGIALHSHYDLNPADGSEDIQTLLALRYGGQFPISVPGQDRVGRARLSFGTQFFPYTFSMATTETPLSLNASDDRGKRTPGALAANSGRTLASMPRWGILANAIAFDPTLWGANAATRRAFAVPATDPAVFFSAHFITDTSLPTLTGVAEAGARFAPIWQFGAYPQ